MKTSKSVRWELQTQWGHASTSTDEGALTLYTDGSFELWAPCGEDAPPEGSGCLDGLWNYEVMELFLGSSTSPDAPYLEFEFGRHGHWLALEMSAYRERAALLHAGVVQFDTHEAEGRWFGAGRLHPALWATWGEMVRWGYVCGLRTRQHTREFWVSHPGDILRGPPDFHALTLRRPFRFLP